VIIKLTSNCKALSEWHAVCVQFQIQLLCRMFVEWEPEVFTVWPQITLMWHQAIWWKITKPSHTRVIFRATLKKIIACFTNPNGVKPHRKHPHFIGNILSWSMGLDSSNGIATLYGSDGPGIESRRERDFSHTSSPILRSTQPPIQWVPALFSGGKAAGAWR
jgi:hypothetical protein